MNIIELAYELGMASVAAVIVLILLIILAIASRFLLSSIIDKEDNKTLK